MAESKEEAESNKRVIYTYPMVKQVRNLNLQLKNLESLVKVEEILIFAKEAKNF